MIKKVIVAAQCLVVLVLGAMVLGQIGLSPERARHIDRREPLWFLNPWRPGGQEAAPAADNVKTQLDTSARGEATRRYVLSPTPALNALVTDLENKSLQPVTSILDKTPQTPAQAPGRESAKTPPAPAAREKPAASGPIRITGLAITPETDGVTIKGTTSAPVGQMDLVTYTAPPRVIVELHGRFSRYAKKIPVPQNPCIRSVTTLPAANRMRLVIDLLSPEAAIAPIARASQDGFEIKLMAPSAATAATQPAKQ